MQIFFYFNLDQSFKTYKPPRGERKLMGIYSLVCRKYQAARIRILIVTNLRSWHSFESRLFQDNSLCKSPSCWHLVTLERGLISVFPNSSRCNHWCSVQTFVVIYHKKRTLQLQRYRFFLKTCLGAQLHNLNYCRNTSPPDWICNSSSLSFYNST